MFIQAPQEALSASSECESNLYCETRAKPVALRVMADAYRPVRVTSLLSTRHPEPVLGILPAKFGLHAVAGTFRVIGTGEPLGIFLLGGAVDAWRLSCRPVRLSSILAWLAELWTRGPESGWLPRSAHFAAPFFVFPTTSTTSSASFTNRGQSFSTASSRSNPGAPTSR